MTIGKSFEPRYDVVVVGGRAAGASAAMLLARAGLRVAVVERGQRGADTLSTHALMRGAVVQLSRWGLLDRAMAAGTPPVRSTTFHYGDTTVPLAIKPRFGVDALCAPRRPVLDGTLAAAAEEAGADVVFGARVSDLSRDASGRVNGVVVEDAPGRRRHVAARLVVGADGLRSTVARLAGAAVLEAGSHGAAVIYGYWSGLSVDGYHWYYRPGVSAGAIPTNDGLVCVFASMPSSRFLHDARFRQAAAYHEVLREVSPALAGHVARGRLVGPLRGWTGEPGVMRQASGPGWALVGDAGCFRDPITAHGLTDALRDAELLAAAAREDGERAWRDYAAQRDVFARPLFDLSDRIASFTWDLDELQALHRALSEAMVREAEWIAALGGGHDRPACGTAA